jgi:hypothetical protein
MVRDTSHLRPALHDGPGGPGGRGSHPGELPRPFADNRPIPRIDNQDDDEDNVRTQMRTMPKDDLAAMIARATAVAEARVGAPTFGERAAPQAGAPAPSPPRPGLRMPSPGAYGAAAAPAPAFGGRPAPVAPPPAIIDDDSSEDNARTMMRTPEQMDEDSVDSSPRTVLLRDGQSPPWQPQAPLPAAGQPAAPPGIPSWGDAAVRGGPAPAATMALPSYYEPAAPYPGHPAPDLRGLEGTQKIPPGLGYDPRAPSAAVTTLPLDMPPIAGLAGGPQHAYQPAPNGGPAGFTMGAPSPNPRPEGSMGLQTAGSAPYPPSSQPLPVLVPEPAKSSRTGLVVAAAIALLLAAVATFAFLKLKGL